MKNRLIITAIILISCLLTACEGNIKTTQVTTQTIWEAVVNAVPEDTLPLMMDIDASALKSYYGISVDSVMDFTGQMPLLNVAVTEILLIRAQKNQTDEILHALENRRTELEEKWSISDETQYALVQNCRIVQNSDWLLFAIAERVDEIVSAFNTCIDGSNN